MSIYRSGRPDPGLCSTCNSTGRYVIFEHGWPDHLIPCPDCGGTGIAPRPANRFAPAEWPPPETVGICPYHDFDVDGFYRPLYRDGLCKSCHEREIAEYAACREADEAYLRYQADRALVDTSTSYDAEEVPW